MQANLLRVSQADNLPFKKSTLYKWKCLKKFPGLFVKFAGVLFIDLDVLGELIEAGRLKK
jgi:hypothetical protein